MDSSDPELSKIDAHIARVQETKMANVSTNEAQEPVLTRVWEKELMIA
jgi:hypothetical protein